MKPNYYSCIINQRIYQSLTPACQKTKLHPNTFTSINIFIDFLFLIALFLYNRGTLQKLFSYPYYVVSYSLTHSWISSTDMSPEYKKNKRPRRYTRPHIRRILLYPLFPLYGLRSPISQKGRERPSTRTHRSRVYRMYANRSIQ